MLTPAGRGAICLKSAEEIELMAESGRIVKEVLKLLSKIGKPGVSTIELDKAAYDYISGQDAEPAFLGFHGYPASICVSINCEVVHGIPTSERALRSGDIVSLDVGVKKKGFYGDAALTIGIGEIAPEAKRLLEVAAEVLDVAIAQAVVDNRVGDISHAIQCYVERHGFNVVRDFVGHGIGSQMHEPPQIPNFGPAGRGPRLKEGMVLAIEPMVNVGGCQVETLADNWTVVTADRLLSAHFEHSVAITANGPRVLTRA